MEYVVPARIAKLQVIDPGEIRRVQLVLPQYLEIKGRRVPLLDTMRPGTAFLAKPWGSRTDKVRRRMYTRSNSSNQEPGILETFINHTHRQQADTSIWWQSKIVDDWYEKEQGIDVRVTFDEDQNCARVYENTAVCKESNLRLEPDGEWEGRRLICLAFGTGITPFLSYIRYMAHGDWLSSAREPHGNMTLMVSARHEGQLMLHQELLEIARKFPEHFQYIPVLTRSWPNDWTSLKGRMIRINALSSGGQEIDLSPLQTSIPNIAQSDLRICGSIEACRQLLQGLQENDICPVSVRKESW